MGSRDDHDYGPNDSDRSYRLKEASLETHKLFWANQVYGTESTPGVFSRFEWADVEFFLLDDRYYRSPNKSPDDSQKNMLGREQLQWLKDALVSSRATFKIVVNGNQMLNPRSPFEALSRFSVEYEDLLAFIKQARISGLIFLSGDRHFSELICLRDSAFYPLYDYTSSSLTAGLFTNVAFSVNSGRTFAAPLEVASGRVIGRVDVVLLGDGRAIVSWLQEAEVGAEIRAQPFTRDGAAGPAVVVASTSVHRASGFPQMIHTGDGLLFAWTEATDPPRVRTAFARLL